MLFYFFAFATAWNYQDKGRDWPGLCASGGLQSPVALSSVLAKKVSSSASEYFFLELGYKKTRISNHNSSYLSGFNYLPGKNFHIFKDFGEVFIGSKAFRARYLKFHSPSEHLIDLKSFSLEMQVVHGSGNSSLVLCVMFFISEHSNKLLDSVIQAFGNVAGENVWINDAVGGWFAVKDFWTYEGSLTEPPCSEQVKYVIVKDAQPASLGQILFFKNILEGNTREPMPLNSRPVQLFEGLKDSSSPILLLPLTLLLIH
jgi:carbonic anhydrase